MFDWLRISIGVALALPILPATVAAVGDFLPYQAYPVGSTPEAVAIGDVTGDGRNDVVMTTSYDLDPANDFRLWVFAGTEYGTLAPPSPTRPRRPIRTARPRSRSVT